MSGALELITLGGCGGFGMNATLLAAGDASILIDFGIGFPDPADLGVQHLVPDARPLVERFPAPLAVVVTHAHDDHCAGLPWLPHAWRAAPIYAPPLALASIADRFEDLGITPPDLRPLADGPAVSIGPFSVECARVTHSVPQTFAVAIDTPAGLVVHSADFKLDPHPPLGAPTDTERLEAWGARGVRLLLADSTGATTEGRTPSESAVPDEIEQAFAGVSGQIVFSTFSSHIDRLGAAIEIGGRAGRKTAVLGRRIARMLAHAADLGLGGGPAGLRLDARELLERPPARRLWLAGGCQGEPSSSLVRLARGEIAPFDLGPGDRVVVSARVIPGNGPRVAWTIDRFLERGVEVVHADLRPALHVSGHGAREEIAELIRRTRPRAVVPIHGSRRHLEACAALARDTLDPPPDVVVIGRGELLRVEPGGVRVVDRLELHPMSIGESGREIGFSDLLERRAVSRAGAVVVLLEGPAAAPRVAAVTSVGLAAEDLAARVTRAVETALGRAGDRREEPAGELVERIARRVRRTLRDGARHAPVVRVLWPGRSDAATDSPEPGRPGGEA